MLITWLKYQNIEILKMLHLRLKLLLFFSRHGSKEFTSLEHCLCGVGVCVSVCSEHGSSGPVCLWWGYHPDHRDMQQDDGTNATSPPVPLLTRRHFTRRDFSLSVDTNTR